MSDMHAETVAEATLEVTITRGPNHPHPGRVENLGIVSRYHPSALARWCARILRRFV